MFLAVLVVLGSGQNNFRTRLRTLIRFWEVEAPAETCFCDLLFRQSAATDQPPDYGIVSVIWKRKLFLTRSLA